MSQWLDMAHDGGYRGEEAERVAARLEAEERAAVRVSACEVCGATNMADSCFENGQATRTQCPHRQPEIELGEYAQEKDAEFAAWIGFFEDDSGALKVGYVREDVFERVCAALEDGTGALQVRQARREVQDVRDRAVRTGTNGATAL